MLSTSESLSWLLQALNEASEREQYLHLEPPLYLYHRGIYSSAASIWCETPTQLQEQTGRFDICTQLVSELLLIVIDSRLWQELRHQLELENCSQLRALECLCQLLESSHLQLPRQLQGFACAITGHTAPPLLLLFDPLHNLQLYDIQDRYA